MTRLRPYAGLMLARRGIRPYAGVRLSLTPSRRSGPPSVGAQVLSLLFWVALLVVVLALTL